jgi:hypothetical protein
VARRKETSVFEPVHREVSRAAERPTGKETRRSTTTVGVTR